MSIQTNILRHRHSKKIRKIVNAGSNLPNLRFNCFICNFRLDPFEYNHANVLNNNNEDDYTSLCYMCGSQIQLFKDSFVFIREYMVSNRCLYLVWMIPIHLDTKQVLYKYAGIDMFIANDNSDHKFFNLKYEDIEQFDVRMEELNKKFAKYLILL